MSFAVNFSTAFQKDLKPLAKKYPSLLADIAELVENLERSPTIGEPLGRDCYKIRLNIRSKRRGKRGGGRVISYLKIVEEQVYLVALYDKSNRETISDAELDARLKAVGS